MDWLRWYTGTATDPKWMLVAATAGDGVTPGDCVGVWAALMEYASQQRPRGHIDGFKSAPLAMFFGWPSVRIEKIFAAMQSIGMHDGRQLTAWAKRQPDKEDRTAAARKRRQRAAAKQSNPDEMSRLSRRDTVTVTKSHASRPLEEIERSSSSDYSSSLDCKDNTPNNRLNSSAREKLSSQGLWAWLESEGMPVGLLARTTSMGIIRALLNQSITAEHLDEAMRRARANRKRAEDSRPVNLPFLNCFIADVIAGRPERSSAKGGMADGDKHLDDYAASRGA